MMASSFHQSATGKSSSKNPRTHADLLTACEVWEFICSYSSAERPWIAFHATQVGAWAYTWSQWNSRGFKRSPWGYLFQAPKPLLERPLRIPRSEGLSLQNDEITLTCSFCLVFAMIDLRKYTHKMRQSISYCSWRFRLTWTFFPMKNFPVEFWFA